MAVRRSILQMPRCSLLTQRRLDRRDTMIRTNERRSCAMQMQVGGWAQSMPKHCWPKQGDALENNVIGFFNCLRDGDSMVACVHGWASDHGHVYVVSETWPLGAGRCLIISVYSMHLSLTPGLFGPRSCSPF